MDFKKFVRENTNKPLFGSFRPACSNSHFENKGSLTLYGWVVE